MVPSGIGRSLKCQAILSVIRSDLYRLINVREITLVPARLEIVGAEYSMLSFHEVLEVFSCRIQVEALFHLVEIHRCFWKA